MSGGTNEAYSRFAHFLQRAGFTPAQWNLAIDTTGEERGIRATQPITINKPTSNTTPPSHQRIISIPASLLITPDRVRSSTFARSLLATTALASLSAEQLLILWLVYQRRLGESSSAYPYIALLPSYYSSLEWWTEEEVQLFPHSIDSVAVDDKESDEEAGGQHNPVHYHRSLCSRIRTQWQHLNKLLSTQHPPLQQCQHDHVTAEPHSLPLSIQHHRLPPPSHPSCPISSHPLSCLISLAEYQWAHSTVSTRSCYWPDDGSCCLIPFLDMLNHSADIVCTCHYNPATRLYSLYTQRKPTSVDTAAAAPLLHISAGSEVHISYGALSNWQLLVRYGFVLEENVDEKDVVSVQWLEEFIQRRCNAKEKRSQSQPHSTEQRRQPPQRVLSNVRCCCGRSLLWQSLATLRPSVAAAAQLPHVPPLSSKHAKLLSLCGLYSPATFSLTCCTQPWDVTTYIKCRTVPLPPAAAPQPTTDTLQRWADTILNDEWVDTQHERRGRELIAAILVERMGRGGYGESETSLEEQMGELASCKRQREQTSDEGGEGVGSDCDGSSASGVSVSVLCRVLSLQFRVARRRLLLGALQHQLDAIQQS